MPRIPPRKQPEKKKVSTKLANIKWSLMDNKNRQKRNFLIIKVGLAGEKPVILSDYLYPVFPLNSLFIAYVSMINWGSDKLV